MSKNITFVGLDVHQETIVAAILHPRRKTPEIARFANNEAAVRRFVRKLVKAVDGPISTCYEAGPTGFALKRLLDGLQIHCQVIAPSLIPAKPGDRIKTDRRDAVNLAELLRAELLTEVRPPTPDEEAVRDLSRAGRLALKALFSVQALDVPYQIVDSYAEAKSLVLRCLEREQGVAGT